MELAAQTMLKNVIGKSPFANVSSPNLLHKFPVVIVWECDCLKWTRRKSHRICRIVPEFDFRRKVLRKPRDRIRIVLEHSFVID